MSAQALWSSWWEGKKWIARGIPFLTSCYEALCAYLNLNCVSSGNRKGRVGKVRTAHQISWIGWERILFGIWIRCRKHSWRCVYTFRAMTICQRPSSHGSHEVALQSLLAPREKYWVGSFTLSVNLDRGHCNFPRLQTASKDPMDILLHMSSGLGFRLKSCCELGRREMCGKEEMRTEGKDTARADSRMEKWRYTGNLSLPEMQNRKLLTWHPTWNRAIQNTISSFGGVHDQSSKEEETSWIWITICPWNRQLINFSF